MTLAPPVMERFNCPRLRRFRFLTGIALACLGTLAVAPTTSNAAPSFSTQRFFGVDYVDARDVARRFGLAATWTEPQRSMRLKNANTTLELTEHSVDATLNGMRIFLGEPVVIRDGQLYVGESDAEDFLAPMLTPRVLKPRRPLKTIVIDPGHGGSDPGNQNHRLKLSEKTYTLDVARRLEKLLKAQGYRVILTRKSDRAMDLEARTALANKARADLFISIHFNAFPRGDVAGTETYVMTPRNQRSSPQAERDRSMVSTRYPANAHDHWNASLGFQIHRSMVTALRSADRGLKRFRYSVLRTIDCPAVLVEAAFLSNDAEGRRVSTAAYRQRIAESIATGVRQHALLNASGRGRKS